MKVDNIVLSEGGILLIVCLVFACYYKSVNKLIGSNCTEISCCGFSFSSASITFFISSRTIIAAFLRANFLLCAAPSAAKYKFLKHNFIYSIYREETPKRNARYKQQKAHFQKKNSGVAYRGPFSSYAVRLTVCRRLFCLCHRRRRLD